MQDTYNFLAFDLGATSGRTMLGTLTDGKLELKELTRFPNNILRIGGKYYWNIYSLFEELKRGLRQAASEGIVPDAVGIDTWGVDYAYIAEDGSVLGLPRSYRDPYTQGAPEEFFKQISRNEVYEATGIQIMDFNSLFQLHAAKKEDYSALKYAESMLFIPDALAYMLTGKKICEYTIASTSQILNPRTKKLEQKLLDVVGLNASVFPEVIMPGAVIGNLTEDLAKEYGWTDIPVVAVAGHDTASAVIAVPSENRNFAYLSSGTWSLMGIEVDEPIINEQSFGLNFTNEGGVDGTIRFLKNITGMWLLEQCRKEWERQGKTYTYKEIAEMCGSVAGFRSLIDPDNGRFVNPESMTTAIADYCLASGQRAPESDAEFIRCIFDSLALKYRYVLNRLREVAPFPIEKLHVIGGGSQNRLLNQSTANAIGIPVVAGPAEATAVGNIMMQAKGLGCVGTLAEIRSIVRGSVEIETLTPQDTAAWNEAYARFLSVTKLEE